MWNPLIRELICSSAVMLALWDRMLGPQQRTHLTECFGTGDEDTARRVAGFLAGISRVGHANPARMASFGRGDDASPMLEKAGAEWREQALHAGLPLPPAHTRLRRADPEHITAAVLPRLAGCDCAGFVDGEQCRAQEHSGLYRVAYALDRHNGNILHADTVAKAYRATGGPAWDSVRADLVEAVAHHVEIQAGNLPKLIRPVDPVGLSAFSRLVSQCNRLSRGKVDPGFASPHDSCEEMSDKARLQAQEAVSQVRVS